MSVPLGRARSAHFGSDPARPDFAASGVLSASQVLARDRILPVHEALVSLFASVDGSPVGLVRGHTVVCTGSAAVSCALGVVAGPTRVGSWAAVVGLTSLGPQAAGTLGVALERTVFVDVPEPRSRDRTSDATTSQDLAAVLSAIVDGMDLLVLSHRVVTGMSPALVRRLQTRIQAKGSVLVVIGDPGSVAADVRLTARTRQWEGIGQGYGHLRRRLVDLELHGRRNGRVRRHAVWLPDATGGLMSAEVSSLHIESLSNAG